MEQMSSFASKFSTTQRRVGIGASALIIAVLLGTFQNCANIKPSAKSVMDQASIETRAESDRRVFGKYLNENSLKVWVSARESVVVAPAGVISSMEGVKTYTLPLAPLGPGPQFDTGERLRFSAGQNLVTDAADVKMRSDRYSIIAVVDTTAVGRLASVQVSAGVQDLAIFGDGTKYWMSRTSSNGNSVTVEAPINSSSLHVIAASFGLEASEVLGQLHGTPISASATNVGAPVASTYSTRRLMLGDSSGGTSNFRLREVMVFTEALSQHELNAFSRLIGEKWGVTDLEYVP
jgi:hypothetical protein